MESAQDREARKKKVDHFLVSFHKLYLRIFISFAWLISALQKELKKMLAAQSGAPTPAATGATLISTAPTPSAAATPGFRPPQTPASIGVGTPRPQGPGPGPPTFASGRPGTPSQAQLARLNGTPVPRPGSVKKRELEEDGGNAPLVNGVPASSVGQGVQKRPPPGSGGVKPTLARPQKKARTVCCVRSIYSIRLSLIAGIISLPRCHSYFLL